MHRKIFNKPKSMQKFAAASGNNSSRFLCSEKKKVTAQRKYEFDPDILISYISYPDYSEISSAFDGDDTSIFNLNFYKIYKSNEFQEYIEMVSDIVLNDFAPILNCILPIHTQTEDRQFTEEDIHIWVELDSDKENNPIGGKFILANASKIDLDLEMIFFQKNIASFISNEIPESSQVLNAFFIAVIFFAKIVKKMLLEQLEIIRMNILFENIDTQKALQLLILQFQKIKSKLSEKIEIDLTASNSLPGFECKGEKKEFKFVGNYDEWFEFHNILNDAIEKVESVLKKMKSETELYNIRKLIKS